MSEDLLILPPRDVGGIALVGTAVQEAIDRLSTSAPVPIPVDRRYRDSRPDRRQSPRIPDVSTETEAREAERDMANDEEWRTVVGFPQYEVSCLGRVRSKRSPKRVLRGQRHEAGYRKIYLGLSGAKQITRYLHVLVLEAFSGPRPVGMEALHGPNGATDNSLSNLKWGSHAENVADQARDGTRLRGQKKCFAKLTDMEVSYIKFLLDWGVVETAVANAFGVSRSAIGHINQGCQWTHISAYIIGSRRRQ